MKRKGYRRNASANLGETLRNPHPARGAIKPAWLSAQQMPTRTTDTSKQFQRLLELARKPVTSERDWREFQVVAKGVDDIRERAMRLEDDDKLLLGASLGELARRIVSSGYSSTRVCEALSFTTVAIELVSKDLSRGARMAMLLNAGNLELEAIARSLAVTADRIRMHFSEALLIASESRDVGALMEANIGLGEAIQLQHHVGAVPQKSQLERVRDIQTAIRHFETALESAEDLGDSETYITTLNRLAGAWAMLSDHDASSLDHARSALSQAESRAKTLRSKELLAQIAHNRAVLELITPGIDNLGAAIADLHYALEIRQRGEPRVEAETRLALARALMRRSGNDRANVVEDAKRHLRKAIKIFQTTADRPMEHATAIMHLGSAYLESAKNKKDLSIALALFDEAKNVFPEHAVRERALLEVNLHAGSLQLHERFAIAFNVDHARRSLLESSQTLAAYGYPSEALHAAALAERIGGSPRASD